MRAYALEGFAHVCYVRQPSYTEWDILTAAFCTGTVLLEERTNHLRTLGDIFIRGESSL